MKVAILIAPSDFRDETLSRLRLWLDKKDITGIVASLSLKDCTGYHGAVVRPKADISSMQPSNYDVLLIADGPGVDEMGLYNQRPLLDLVKTFYESKKIIAGIGNGIKVIARANVIKDIRIAKPDAETEKLVRLYRGIPSDDYIVFDNNVLTLSDSEKIDELVAILVEKSGA